MRHAQNIYKNKRMNRMTEIASLKTPRNDRIDTKGIVGAGLVPAQKKQINKELRIENGKRQKRG